MSFYQLLFLLVKEFDSYHPATQSMILWFYHAIRTPCHKIYHPDADIFSGFLDVCYSQKNPDDGSLLLKYYIDVCDLCFKEIDNV
jgi:hypothetical protein